MHPLTKYYIHQAVGGGSSGGVGPICALPPYVQRGHETGDYLGPLFRALKPLFFTGLRSAGKALGREPYEPGEKFFPILLTIHNGIQRHYFKTCSGILSEFAQ